MTRGSDLIAAERARQVDVEGFDAEHDRGHARELALAGAAYAVAGSDPLNSANIQDAMLDLWPWEIVEWNPSGDAKRDLVRAGALIAAAIDALP